MKNFDEWNEIKKNIHKKETILKFSKRDIFFINLGQNIGYEQNGVGDEFLRPVLILRKFNKRFFLGVLLSSKNKNNPFYYKIGEDSFAILSQVRTFDAKRLSYFVKRLNENKFFEVVEKISDLLPKRESGLTSNFVKESISQNNNNFKLYTSTQRDIKVGKNVVIVNPSNLYECFLDDNVFVGPFCEIQKGVRIGKNTRIQSHTFICELVTIGENCFIGHGVMFVNDLFSEGKPSSNSDEWKETKIGNNVSIGSNATILPVQICANVVIGAGSVVTKDIIESGIYAGNPAKKLRDIK